MRTKAAVNGVSMRVGAGEDPHLAAFLRRRRREHHRAVAEQHERRHAFGGFGDEHVAGRQAQLEIDRLDRPGRCAANCFCGCSARRCRPSIDDSFSWPTMRHGWRSVESRGRRMSRRHVVMRPRAPVSVKTSAISR